MNDSLESFNIDEYILNVKECFAEYIITEGLHI
jgi:hypothetical protein